MLSGLKHAPYDNYARPVVLAYSPDIVLQSKGHNAVLVIGL